MCRKNVFFALVLCLGMMIAMPAFGQMSGAIFTTNSSCAGVDGNNYGDKDAVYIDGGPRRVGSAGLPDGNYYVKVTEPNGTLLGSSPIASLVVTNGEVSGCLQLSSILVKASDASAGYDSTTNPGCVYKAWASQNPSFPQSESKTDNFRVCEAPVPPANVIGFKFYDADVSGSLTAGDTPISGWQINSDTGVARGCTGNDGQVVFPGILGVTYNLSEVAPPPGFVPNAGAIWINTTPTTGSAIAGDPDLNHVDFGNVCIGAGGGLTLGFWSNRNGQALITSTDIAALVALNLRNGNGTAFDPASSSAFRTWILSANATNMAYMLSAQLSAMNLNVAHGFVKANALIYAPGTGLSASGFATVQAVMDAANASLGTDGYTVASGTVRTYQEALKNALDKANNNLNFLQTAAQCQAQIPACPYAN